jgi:hypothetical protein
MKIRRTSGEELLLRIVVISHSEGLQFSHGVEGEYFTGIEIYSLPSNSSKAIISGKAAGQTRTMTSSRFTLFVN